MNIDRGNRNCYNCERFGYLVRNYRNRRIKGRIGKGKRLEYGKNEQRTENNRQSNLNGREIQ